MLENQRRNMSIFANMLSQFIDQSGLTIKHLSQVSGFEATHLTKFRKGTRRPHNMEKLGMLIHELQLPPSDQEKLMDAYYMDCVGENRYLRHMAVKALIENADEFPHVKVDASYSHALEHVSVLRRNSNVVNVLTKVVEQECSKQESALRVMAQPGNPQLMDLLYRAAVDHPGMTIDHIVCLQTEQKGIEAGTYNVQCAGHMLNMMRQARHYTPLYYYEKSTLPQDNGMLFPVVLISSDYVLCISADYEYGMLHKGREMLDFYRTLFDIHLQKCATFGQTNPTLLDTMQFYGNLYLQLEEKAFTCLQSQPCFMPFLKREYGRFLAVEEHILSAFFDGYQKLLNQNRITSIFPLSGLEAFFREGIVTNAVGHMDPFPINVRVQMVRNMLEAVDAGCYDFLIIKPAKMHVPFTLGVVSMAERYVGVELAYPSDTVSSIAFTEPSINLAVSDFMSFLPQSQLVYSKAESRQLAGDMLNSIKADDPCYM